MCIVLDYCCISKKRPVKLGYKFCCFLARTESPNAMNRRLLQYERAWYDMKIKRWKSFQLTTYSRWTLGSLMNVLTNYSLVFLDSCTKYKIAMYVRISFKSSGEKWNQDLQIHIQALSPPVYIFSFAAHEISPFLLRQQSNKSTHAQKITRLSAIVYMLMIV